jgi:hypothetical protein
VSLLFAGAAAQADVWMWTDSSGQTHFVDTDTPIYAWVDENGDYHYSDTPEHEDAVSVRLVWISGGTIEDVQKAEDESGAGYAYPGETPEDRARRENAEAYHCERATEIYESYVNAPRLYKTDEAGERVYLSKEEAARTIAETRAQKDEVCP